MPMNYGLRDGQRSMLSVTVREELPRRAGGRGSDSVNPSTHLLQLLFACFVWGEGRELQPINLSYFPSLLSLYLRVNCRIWG